MSLLILPMAGPFTLNPKAQTGFQNASAYDTHRPSYPPEAVDKLLTYLGVKNTNKAKIIDIGSGTGKFTELLVGRDEAYEIVAVEPHEGMREVLVSKRLGERVQVVDGNAGSIPLEDGWGDAVVAAQVSTYGSENGESCADQVNV
jgi:SAM-dependent methyltransferase